MRNKDPKFVILLQDSSRIGFPAYTRWCTANQPLCCVNKRWTYPVKMTVPGSRVVPCDKNEMIFGIEKIRSLDISELRHSGL
jgi:hypothetical protein